VGVSLKWATAKLQRAASDDGRAYRRGVEA
jgi:hypothetical protein